MIVQRLTRWLRAKTAHVAVRLRTFVRTMPMPDASRQTVLSGSMTRYAAGSAIAPFMSQTSWLDDAHRLRPHRTPPTTTPLLSPRNRTISNRLRTVSGVSSASGASETTAAASAESSHVAAAPSPAQTPPPAPVLPPSHASRPTAPAPASAESAEPTTETFDATDQALHRRLMSLKHLVRLGIYNEGFSSTRVPEQYQRSLGLEDFTRDE